MIKIKPVLTEKSIADAKNGKYTFWVPRGLNKPKIKKVIGEIFGVSVKTVSVMNYKSVVKTSMWRRRKTVQPARKKAVVVLKGKDKIDLFAGEEKKKK